MGVGRGVCKIFVLSFGSVFRQGWIGEMTGSVAAFFYGLIVNIYGNWSNGYGWVKFRKFMSCAKYK